MSTWEAIPQRTAASGMDCLKLTTYFGERDRTPTGLLADELADLFAKQRVRASVLLRGAEGFGQLHHLHTDRLLSLSEGLPMVAVAIDSHERIGELLDPALNLASGALATVERARLFSGEIKAVQLPERLEEAAKLTLYLQRHERTEHAPTFIALCELLHRRGLSGASVLLGVDGTRDRQRARARFFSRNAEVPLMLIAVGPSQRIAGVLPEIDQLLREPLLTLERVRVCKRDGELLAKPHQLPATDARGMGLWQKLTIYSSQSTTHDGHPLHLQIVRRLRAAGAAGVTCLRGVWGFHGDHAPHGDRFLQVRRGVPMLSIVIDTPARIARWFAIVDELTAEHGLVTCEMVPALRARNAVDSHFALELANHDF